MYFILFLCAVPLILWYLIKDFYRTKHSYWKDRNVSYIEPTFPFGNFQNPLKLKKSSYLHLQDLYDVFKARKVPVGGIYIGTIPNLLLIDTKVIKKVLAQDFQYFMDRGVHCDEVNEPLSAHLFALQGQRWKNLRAKLTPTFTTGKMKLMFQILSECANIMVQKINASKTSALDIKDIVACYTTDVIASCAFGLDSNSYDENSQFRLYGKKLFMNTPLRLVRVFFVQFYPNLAKKMGLTVFERDINDFFMKAVVDMVRYREENSVQRNDFFQLLLDLKNNKDEAQNLTMNELAAQAFVFFTAGFETSSTTLQFSLYELAKDHEIQEKARREVLDVSERYKGEMTYDALAEMKYLNQVVEETLRKYPPLPMLNRKCLKDYHLSECDLTIEKGTSILVSLFGLHYSEEFYPNPEKFDPERFSEENKQKIPPYAFLAFGDGPRVCIGLRFGMMQTKLGLASILKNFKLTVSDKTSEPITFHKNNFLLSPEQTIYLDAKQL